MNDRRAVRTGFFCIIICYILWGFQPLYWHLDDTFDSMFIMASRSVFASLFSPAAVIKLSSSVWVTTSR